VNVAVYPATRERIRNDLAGMKYPYPEKDCLLANLYLFGNLLGQVDEGTSELFENNSMVLLRSALAFSPF